MIRVELTKLLGERSLYWLSQESRIRWPTIAALAKGKLRRIDFEALDRICEALECQPGDLLVRVGRKTRKKGK
jgi:putative transcriptional regulator